MRPACGVASLRASAGNGFLTDKKRGMGGWMYGARRALFAGGLSWSGFGCIGQATLPLLLRHIDMQPAQVLIVEPDGATAELARSQGAQFLQQRVDSDNFRQCLEPLLGAGDFLINLAVDVNSVALIEFCQSRGALYLDTCIEPWPGGYFDASLPPAQRTNYAQREAALALRRPTRDGPTAVVNHGANPGLVSHLLKQALLDLARDTGLAIEVPRTRADWARLAQRLAVRVIHVAERDTQVGSERKSPGEFVNTWSVLAFIDEGCQPAELGWGSHERRLPADGARHETGSRAAIYLNRPGAATQVRSWTPCSGPMHGFLITHGESISIADLLTLGDPAAPSYRPTVHYAYHPCDDAVLSLLELAGRNWRIQERQRVLKEEIVSGIDELGVLLMGHARSALLVRLAAVRRAGARAVPVQQRHQPAGRRAGHGRGAVGDRQSGPRRRRARRPALRRHAAAVPAVPRRRRRRLQRLDAAGRPRAAVHRGPGPGRSLAVRQLSRRLTAPARGGGMPCAAGLALRAARRPWKLNFDTRSLKCPKRTTLHRSGSSPDARPASAGPWRSGCCSAAGAAWSPPAIRRRSRTSSPRIRTPRSRSRSTSRRRRSATKRWRGRRPRTAASTCWSTTPATAISLRSRKARTTRSGRCSRPTSSASPRCCGARCPACARARRGHIINVSSIGGLIGNTGAGYYCASKFALEGLTESLAQEVGPLGIRVTLIEPGPFRTDWAGRSLRIVKSPMDAYAGTFGVRRAQLLAASGKQRGDPVRAADAIIKVAESPDPPLHLLLGRNGLLRYREKLDALKAVDRRMGGGHAGGRFSGVVARRHRPGIEECPTCPTRSSSRIAKS